MEERANSLPGQAENQSLNVTADPEPTEATTASADTDQGTPATPEGAPAEDTAEAPEGAETPETAEAPTPEKAGRPAPPATMEEALERLKALGAKDAAEITAEETARLKQQFYALRNEQLRAAREAWVAEEEGRDPEAFVAEPCAEEEEFKGVLSIIKDKKAQQRAALEAQQARNLDAKREIVAKIVSMSSDADNANRYFQQVRELQTQFKETGEVAPTAHAEIWKSYQDAVERFYDQLKINKELRDYDFKKNLTEKEALVSEASKLNEEPDVIIAFRRLQGLHDQWRNIGPVPKEVREEIWGRFKEISSEINKKYQAFFEERKAQERENEAAKEALCERIEAIDFSSAKSYSAWESMTKQIMAAQEEWKKIGYASRKSNNPLFARFRATCDKFFTAKAEFYHTMKSNLSENLEKKLALCERAEALKESTEWRKTSEELAQMQKEWKQIGAVAKKHSDQVWHRFLAACDYFFDRKKKSTSGTRRTERANLEQKQDIIAKLRAIDPESMSREEAVKAVKDLQAEWQSVGHVPFGEKDKVYDTYRSVVNGLYDKLDIRERGSRLANFEHSLSEMSGDENRLYRERERLMRVYEQRKSELQTYENNMGFLSAKSKNADSMLRDMERRMQRLRDDLGELENKIKAIDTKL